MSATEFTADLRDIRFLIHEQLDVVGQLTAFERFASLDRDLCDSMIDEIYRIATDVLGPMNRRADRVGCSFDGNGNVTTPPGYKEAWKVMSEGGWFSLAAPEEYGGMGMPHGLAAAIGEITTAACMGFALYPGLTRGAASLLSEFAPDDIKTMICTKLYTGEWAGTMCLTEAGAGSDVGANRARATPTDEPGVYTLVGEKVFISSGDHDLTANILHLVLARTPGAPEGTGGLSIFLVPKFHFDADGAVGERNGAVVGNIEEKLGIHGSATCTLVLGGGAIPCKGWLLGRENEGMRIMFHMMNEARLEVGFQGLAGAAAAYQNSLSYARERVQGSDIRKFGDGAAPKVAIVNHPDVRRMLMWQKVHVEAMRSLIYSTALLIDQQHATDDPKQKKIIEGQVALLTPIIKAYCSDKGFDSTVTALQVYGGYGYTSEYPVEQHMRDTKIASIYEGTNGIQAMDLLGRKMRQASGALFMTWLESFNAELGRCREIPELADQVADLEKARDSLGGSAMHLGGLAMQGNLPGAMLHAYAFLEQFGCVLLGLHTVIQARIAAVKLQGGAAGEDAKFYKGKLLNARFYCSQVLPRAISLGKTIRSNDDSCLDPDLF